MLDLGLKFIKLYDSEKDYRADKSAYNYSLLKDFTTKSLRGWKKKYIDGDNSDDEDKEDMKTGVLAHALLGKMSDLEFDQNFHVSMVQELPKPQDLKFCQNLYKLVSEDSKKSKDNRKIFSDLFEEAFVKTQIKTPKLPKFLENFKNSITEQYFKEMCESNGRQVITLDGLDLAKRVVWKAENTQSLAPIFKSGEEVKHELPICYSFDGVRFRVLIDRLNINHQEKVLKPFDYKVTYAFGEDDFEYNYFKMKYFYQQAMYSKGVEAYRDEFYPDYSIDNFKYIAVDNIGLYDAILHNFQFRGFNDPFSGFSHKGKQYVGIFDIIKYIEWHKSSDNWGIRYSTHLKGGFVNHIVGE